MDWNQLSVFAVVAIILSLIGIGAVAVVGSGGSSPGDIQVNGYLDRVDASGASSPQRIYAYENTDASCDQQSMVATKVVNDASNLTLALDSEAVDLVEFCLKTNFGSYESASSYDVSNLPSKIEFVSDSDAGTPYYFRLFE